VFLQNGLSIKFDKPNFVGIYTFLKNLLAVYGVFPIALERCVLKILNHSVIYD